MNSINFDVYNHHCPSHNILEVISDKWSILIINLLTEKTYRFGELKRKLVGISPKMLSQTLRSLEKYSLVSREEFPVLPLKVEYSLSLLGRELSPLLSSLTNWTLKNITFLIESEKNFDKKIESADRKILSAV